MVGVSKMDFEWAVLYKLHLVANSDGLPINEQQIYQQFTVSPPRLRIKLAIEQLLEDDFIKIYQGDARDTFYIISNKGLARIESLIRTSGFLQNYSKLGDEWLLYSGDREVAEGLTRDVDQTSEDFKKSIEGLAEIENQLRTSNEIGDAFDTDKSIAINEVSFLQKLLLESKVRVNELRQRAKSTLSWIADKGANTIVAELAKSVLKHIMSLF